jgi:hypothetical protein
MFMEPPWLCTRIGLPIRSYEKQGRNQPTGLPGVAP